MRQQFKRATRLNWLEVKSIISRMMRSREPTVHHLALLAFRARLHDVLKVCGIAQQKCTRPQIKLDDVAAIARRSLKKP